MASINLDILKAALDDGLLGPGHQQRCYVHASVNTANRILSYVSKQGSVDLGQVAHHCAIDRNTAAQYLRILARLHQVSPERQQEGQTFRLVYYAL